MVIRFLSTFAFVVFFISAAHSEQGTIKHYSGKLDKKTAVYMRLERTNDSVRGDYIYLSQSKSIPLKGVFRGSHFVIFEFSDQEMKTMSAKFEGDMYGDTLKGIWRSMAKPNEGHSFLLTRSGSTMRRITTKERLIKPYETPDSVVMTDSHYPMFTQLKSFDISERVNRFLADNLHTYSYDAKMPGYDNAKDSTNWFSEASYSIDYVADGVASFTMNTSEYSGGAHPNYGVQYFTLDLNTGAQLKVKDCFNIGQIKKLNKLIDETASECSLPQYDDPNCLHLDPNETNFSLSAEGLKLFRSECYSYASLACAFIEVPLAKVKKFIKPGGPFKGLR